MPMLLGCRGRRGQIIERGGGEEEKRWGESSNRQRQQPFCFVEVQLKKILFLPPYYPCEILLGLPAGRSRICGFPPPWGEYLPLLPHTPTRLATVHYVRYIDEMLVARDVSSSPLIVTTIDVVQLMNHESHASRQNITYHSTPANPTVRTSLC